VYKNHYAFEKPDNNVAQIWKYMTLSEFISLLDSKMLFFCVVNKFEDKFEGSITQKDLENRVSMFNYLKTNYPEYSDDLSIKEKKLRKDLRSLVCINSWHLNNSESAAMWKVHLKENEGIAIQSTFNRFVQALTGDKGNNVYIGKVKYIDYSKDNIPDDHFIYPILHKRQSFEFEHELRAVVSVIPIDKPEFTAFSASFKKYKKGVYVPVDLSLLIEKIFVSPNMENWQLKIVKSLTEKYLSKDFSKNVFRSDLTKKPLS
jgi:hypothetical protein